MPCPGRYNRSIHFDDRGEAGGPAWLTLPAEPAAGQRLVRREGSRVEDLAAQAAGVECRKDAA
ncbi:hypothetical protein GCM10009843_22150 [Nocardioides bigeumensis]|uniref:Uncharacterized protein n=1 Tax=Nocardioides bigeumensis TaxID=433657 RepID=A0ABN2YDA3_9ACTN